MGERLKKRDLTQLDLALIGTSAPRQDFHVLDVLESKVKQRRGSLTKGGRKEALGSKLMYILCIWFQLQETIG